MILLDTNIILRFILDNDPALSPKAKAIFENISRKNIKVFVSLLTISEVIFTLERSYKLPKKALVDKLLAIISQPNIIVEKQDLLKGIFSYYLNQNLSFVDSYHVTIMDKKGINQIHSFDRDFDKFPKIKRLQH